MRIDGTIPDEPFKAKEDEYKRELIEVKSQMNSMRAISGDIYEYAFKTFELSNSLYSKYVSANYESKAIILKFLASNYILIDATPYPTYRKPFDLIAKGLNCSNWLPREDSNLGQRG